MTYDEVVHLALTFPGVEESMSYGTRTLKVGRKFMARLREDDVMVLKPIDDSEKQMLLDTQPESFFITDHFSGWPTVLIRLSRIEPAQMRALIDSAWTQLATKTLLKVRSV